MPVAPECHHGGDRGGTIDEEGTYQELVDEHTNVQPHEPVIVVGSLGAVAGALRSFAFDGFAAQGWQLEGAIPEEATLPLVRR